MKFSGNKNEKEMNTVKLSSDFFETANSWVFQ